MAGKKVEFHEDAALEYEAALEWYLERSLLAASKFVDAMSRGIDMIVEAPHRWSAASRDDFFFNGFRLQSFIASFRRQSRCWRSRTFVANPAIGSNAADLE